MPFTCNTSCHVPPDQHDWPLSMSEQTSRLCSPETRLKLLQRRAELRDRAERTNADIRRAPDLPPTDLAEQAAARQNDEVLDAIKLAARIELEQIEGALARIESGVYGVCAGCGKHIDEARLHALPAAIICAHCASLVS